ncbi:DNA-binding transcriptional regulator, CsgD family [Shimia gijangensis]|uniref:DNA-binding transcriptional regulator, CsgD family n=2 Tax=Shimia gijangensis TaxID=1470563 RepID=A0A1M6F8R1_9RHOB|nr:DNA-binding transcriptional regulator, CsgD family [Shimia gijangensis]
MRYIRQTADIANVGAFYVPDMSRPAPVLSIWAGDMSGYWFNRNAKAILSNKALQDDIIRRIRAAEIDGLAIERWRPSPDDPRAPIYVRDGVIERITVSSRFEGGGFLSFYLRGKNAGWLNEDEVARLSGILPLVHELIGLRHRIIGSEAFHYSLESRVSALKERGVGHFGSLSPREAEVCDMVLKGISVAGTALALGISDNSVRTLRRRAYAKLGVTSAMQIAALVLNDMV